MPYEFSPPPFRIPEQKSHYLLVNTYSPHLHVSSCIKYMYDYHHFLFTRYSSIDTLENTSLSKRLIIIYFPLRLDERRGFSFAYVCEFTAIVVWTSAVVRCTCPGRILSTAAARTRTGVPPPLLVRIFLFLRVVGYRPVCVSPAAPARIAKHKISRSVSR